MGRRAALLTRRWAVGSTEQHRQPQRRQPQRAMSVAESHLKRRAQKEFNAEKQRQDSRKVKLKKKTDRRTEFRHAASYVREFKAHESQEHRMERAARDAATAYVPEKEKLLCVVRIGGVNDMHPKSRKVLQLLQLGHLNNLVFLKLTRATMNMIRKVEPYVAYGYPSLKTVREVIYKRGHGRVGKQRVPLTDNSIIETALGETGIICMEDLVHEIYTVGPSFKQASNFLWPVKLSNLTGGLSTKQSKLFKDGGQAGQREKGINDMVAKMN
jgi:large subunit ribosomal protein L7e